MCTGDMMWHEQLRTADAQTKVNFYGTALSLLSQRSGH